MLRFRWSGARRPSPAPSRQFRARWYVLRRVVRVRSRWRTSGREEEKQTRVVGIDAPIGGVCLVRKSWVAIWSVHVCLCSDSNGWRWCSCPSLLGDGSNRRQGAEANQHMGMNGDCDFLLCEIFSSIFGHLCCVDFFVVEFAVLLTEICRSSNSGHGASLLGTMKGARLRAHDCGRSGGTERIR